MTGGFNLTERIQTVTKKLADVNAEMAWEAAGTAADVAGMVDPTPISDAVGAGIAIRNGDFLGAGLNVVGMIPYLGDAVAKPIKATRVAKRVLALKEKATLLTKELADLNALKKQEEMAELAAKEAKVVADAKKAKDAEKAAAEQEKATAKAKDKDCEDCSTKTDAQAKKVPPKSPTAYSVAYETKLQPADFGKSRSVHFNRANAALDEALKKDKDFSVAMEKLIPDIGTSVSSVGGRATPPGWVWEHAATSTAMGQKGIMRLVPGEQHTPGSDFWRVLHPDKGASGGYSEWAIPAGAPKN